MYTPDIYIYTHEAYNMYMSGLSQQWLEEVGPNHKFYHHSPYYNNIITTTHNKNNYPYTVVCVCVCVWRKVTGSYSTLEKKSPFFATLHLDATEVAHRVW